jgi:hypothetical protein
MLADAGHSGGMSKPAFPPVIHTHFSGEHQLSWYYEPSYRGD